MNKYDYLDSYLQTDLYVDYLKNNPNHIEQHRHESFEILLLLTDGVTILVDNMKYTSYRGSLCVFNHLDVHKARTEGNKPYERCIIHFRPETVKNLSTNKSDLLKCFLNRPVGFSNCILLCENDLEKLLELFRKIYGYWKACYIDKKGNYCDILSTLALVDILIIVNSVFEAQYQGSEVPLKSGNKRVKSIIEYINSHICDELSLEVLSRQFYLSKYRISCIFKAATGFTVNDYIVTKRILAAKEYLGMDFSVSESAGLSGFNNLSHFIKTFKKQVGMSPSQYLKTKNS